MNAIASPTRPAASAWATHLARLKAAPRKPGEASFFWYETHFQSIAVKVLPGEYYVETEDLLIMTTLGSCIAPLLNWQVTHQRAVKSTKITRPSP